MTTNTDALHRLAGVVGAYVDGEGLAVDIEGDGFYLRITDPAAADILAEPELQGATVSLSIFTGAGDDTDDIDESIEAGLLRRPAEVTE